MPKPLIIRLIKVRCIDCGCIESFDVNMVDFEDWKNGKVIQKAMPYLNVAQREMLISQTCNSCFKKCFQKNNR